MARWRETARDKGDGPGVLLSESIPCRTYTQRCENKRCLVGCISDTLRRGHGYLGLEPRDCARGARLGPVVGDNSVAKTTTGRCMSVF